MLLAFLALDDVSVLPQESVLAILDEAAGDPDEVCEDAGMASRDAVGRENPPLTFAPTQ